MPDDQPSSRGARGETPDTTPRAIGHRYLPTGETDRQEMLDAIGAQSINELFEDFGSLLLDEPIEVAGPLSDQELRRWFQGLESKNRIAGRDVVSFLGGGAYRHDVPAAVDHLLQRGEFLTVYTPYQPELSQGTLQAIFEFQTFVSMLTGLDVANASMYEGASAFAEAVLMAHRVQKKRQKVVMSKAIHPHYRATFRTYVQNLGLEVVEIGWDASGRTDAEALAAAVDDDTICVAVQSPNYFGVAEGWRAASAAATEHGALTIGVVTEALSMALLESPGDGGCDIAVGEAQSFGIPLAYGGPYVGFLAARDRFKRVMPGRLAGETVDVDGRRAWVLTLATREQHIRREKATSNICTNQALCALGVTIYLALHGKTGLRRLAEINLQRAAHLRGRLGEAGLSVAFDGPNFNELTVRANGSASELLKRLEGEGVLAGLALGEAYPELDDCFVLAVTETNPVSEIDRLLSALAAVSPS